MAPWQRWYAKTYPDRQPAVPPKADASRWDFDQLVSYLESDKGRFGDPSNGRQIYNQAKCADCHRFGSNSASIGPDLSTIARRFAKREILESILYPAHVVSSQFYERRPARTSPHELCRARAVPCRTHPPPRFIDRATNCAWPTLYRVRRGARHVPRQA